MKQNDDLIRLEPVVQIVRTVAYTGYLDDEKPVSIVLIAQQESAKSLALVKFKDSPGLAMYSDITSKGIESLKDKIQSGEVRHIIILDLIRIVSHGRFVSDRTIQTFAGLMEEGEASSADAGGTTTWKGLPNVGVMMSITPEFFRSKRGRWRDTGFLTRFLPVFFHYCEDTRRTIHEKISTGLNKPRSEILTPPKERQHIELTTQQSETIKNWAVEWGLANATYGFRHHKQIRALVKARALVGNSQRVRRCDMDDVLSWRKFFSTNQPAII